MGIMVGRNKKAIDFINKINGLSNKFGGEGGIRTLEGLLTLAGFQDQCIQPLCHLSEFLPVQSNCATNLLRSFEQVRMIYKCCALNNVFVNKNSEKTNFIEKF